MGADLLALSIVLLAGQAEEPNIIRPPFPAPWISDPYRTGDVLAILGECEGILVVQWEDHWLDVVGNDSLLANRVQFGPLSLFGVDRASGKVLWRQDAGWRTSRILRVEEGAFWQIQQSCEASLFAVERRIRDGAPLRAFDWSALPPLAAFEKPVPCELHEILGKAQSDCSFKRHLHHHPEPSPAGVSPAGAGEAKEAPRPEPAADRRLKGISLNDAIFLEGVVWLHLTVPPQYSDRWPDFLCAADFSRGIWAWYSYQGAGFDKVSVPRWSKVEGPAAGIPWITFSNQVVRDAAGNSFQVDCTSVEHQMVLELTPQRGGRLDPTRKLTHQAVPPQAEKGAWSPEFHAWSPHVVATWLPEPGNQAKAAHVEIFWPGEFVKRIGPLKFSGFGGAHFSAREDRAVLGLGTDLFILSRSVEGGGRISLEYERLDLKSIPSEDGELCCTDARMIGDQVFAAFSLRQKDGASRWRLVSWSGTSGAFRWTSAPSER